ncbi:hypothetical protein [Bacteroidetes bacterium endosymbiont of Geopemphigus sp.]|uniref:hypothetical protein n=1 Tax=Bacteroidetes bacterium endosymbiont of Geopemphigus sp. TaxID=2047937 RepID=UPI0011AEDF6B|nr:hypothetical protein [Bacteroidetes bacterium endosymbiont of Geopemphigus sp.]
MMNVISDNVRNLLNALEIKVGLPYVSINKISLTSSNLAERLHVFFGVPKGPPFLYILFYYKKDIVFILLFDYQFYFA